MQYSNAFRVVAITHMRQYHDGDRNVGDEPLRLPVLEVGLLGARPDGCCGERGASTCAFKEKKCTRSMSRREAFPCRPSSGGAPASPRCRCRRWACSYMKGDEAGACGRFTGNPPRTDPELAETAYSEKSITLIIKGLVPHLHCTRAQLLSFWPPRTSFFCFLSSCAKRTKSLTLNNISYLIMLSLW